MTEEARAARRAYQREWRRKNRDKVNSYRRKWRQANPDKIRQQEERHWQRVADKAAGGDREC